MGVTRRTVLVTDGEQRASLAVARSLGKAGHTVLDCSSVARTITGASRYVQAEYTVADPLTDPDRYLSDIVAIVQASRVDTLMPMTEAALLAILPARHRFPNVLIPFTDADTFRHISDKGAVMDAASRVGIAVPEQHTLHSSDDAQSFAMDAVAFPVVVKPSRSVTGDAGERLKLGVQHTASAAELRRILQAMDPRAYPLLVQQRVIGPGVGVFLLVWNGEVVASFSHRRLREKPPSGGVSVYRESIEMDDALLTRSRSLLDEFNWEGVAMIEYKVDAATGVPYIMEINGRFWGSLQLAIDAGVDFPNLLLQAAEGHNPAPVDRYVPGVRLKWFWGEVDHLITRLISSNAKLALPAGSPSRWAAVRDFLRRHPRDRNEVFRWDDPKPFVRETLDRVVS